MFTKHDMTNLHIIEGEYSFPIVLLSFLIAFGASYTALFINRLIKGKGFFHKNIWLVLASLAMGLGIWSMHFVGMSAYQLPVAMEHNLVLTIISIVPAVLASYGAFYLASSPYKRLSVFIGAGIFMGLGISLMHYLGMKAMEINGHYFYDIGLFSLSIIVAILASFAALYMFSTGQKKVDSMWVGVLAALLMAFAVTSMHYIGVAAIHFYVDGTVAGHSHGEGKTDVVTITTFITAGISSLFVLSYLASKLDKYVDFRVKNFDALTQLPNQNQFSDDQKIEKTTSLVAIVHIHNLEKYILAYGYTFGDVIIKSVLELLEGILSEGMKLYRTEANRFTIVLSKGESTQKMMLSLERICAILQHPLVINERLITVDLVCAVSKSEEAKSTQEQLSNAIAVLQAPSTEYKREVVEYNPKIHTFNFEHQLSLDIQRAMDENELFIVYQPKVNPQQDHLVGVEALIRWNHPDFGMVSPAVFIPILESTHKISDVTDWVIQNVCQQIANWNETGIEFRQISINIPGVYVTSPRLTNVLNENLVRYDVQPSQIELEITETSVIHDMQNAILAVGAFREKGLSVALDDFGTGLSSLAYLKEMPISTIKIDKSFVDGIPNSPKDASILKSIITLCYSLDLNVVIEGVEKVEQIEFIEGLEKAPVVQGYYYSKPLRAEEFEWWLLKQYGTVV